MEDGERASSRSVEEGDGVNEVEKKCLSKGLVYVDGEGPPRAKVMVVGDILGKREGELKKPFVGGAGHLLDSVLNGAGLARSECYVTNVVKMRPPGEKVERLGEIGLTVGEFIPRLKEEIESVRPNVIAALGTVALEALTNCRGIMKWRGSIVESSLVRGQKVIPSPNPAAILLNYKWRPLLALDLKKVAREASSPLIVLPKRELMIEPKFNEVYDVLRMINQKYSRVAYDIEVDTRGLISCISFSPSPKWAISVPFRNGYGSYWSEGEEDAILGMMEREIFQSGKQLVVQNGLFDMMWLVPKVGAFENWMDTMWASQLAYAEIPKGLDVLASIYTDEPYYKDERKVVRDMLLSRQTWEYNAKDAAVTVEVAEKLEQELEQLGLSSFFFGHVMKLQPILLKMQMRGMKIDLGEKEKISKELGEKKEKLEGEMGGFNVRSPQQMAKLLYEELGMKKQYRKDKNGNRRVTTGKKALRKLLEEERR